MKSDSYKPTTLLNQNYYETSEPTSSPFLKPVSPKHPDASEDRNLKLTVIFAIAFVLLVNVFAIVYRRDMPSQVTISEFDHLNASPNNDVIRVSDKVVYKKIIDQYFPTKASPVSSDNKDSFKVTDEQVISNKDVIIVTTDENIVNQQNQKPEVLEKNHNNSGSLRNNNGMHWEIFALLVLVISVFVLYAVWLFRVSISGNSEVFSLKKGLNI
eukprot:403332649